MKLLVSTIPCLQSDDCCMDLQVTQDQQALADADLDAVKSALSSFLRKQQDLPIASSRSNTVGQAPAATGTQAIPASRDGDKAGAAGKKGKGAAEPAMPVLQTVPGQVAELGKWSSMLQTDGGIVLQDADLADWLAGLLRAHC